MSGIPLMGVTVMEDEDGAGTTYSKALTPLLTVEADGLSCLESFLLA